MSKLITKPAECKYRQYDIVLNTITCMHWSNRNKTCPSTVEFPTICPLPDGIVKSVITTTDLLEIDEAKEIAKNTMWPCTLCNPEDKDYCMNVCPLKRD